MRPGASQNRTVVGRFISRAFNAGDLAIVDELLAPGYVLHSTPEVRGPEVSMAVRRYTQVAG